MTIKHKKNNNYPLLNKLHLPQEGSIHQLIEEVESLVAKKIELIEASFVSEIFGVTLYYKDHFIIYFDKNASPVHKSHIIRHELGHIIHGHVEKSQEKMYTNSTSIQEERLAEAFALQYKDFMYEFKSRNKYKKLRDIIVS